MKEINICETKCNDNKRRILGSVLDKEKCNF